MKGISINIFVLLFSGLYLGTAHSQEAFNANAAPHDVDFSYEVKVNLDPVTAQAALPALVSGVSEKKRSTIYYQIDPTPDSDMTIVRARRDTKNKTDITIKLRGISDFMGWLLSNPGLKLEGLGCEYDTGMTGDGQLSCDIKVETSNDTSPLDGDSVMERLDDSQEHLFKIGTGKPAKFSSLDACPTIATRVWKDIAPIAGCTDGATVEIWTFADGPLYELSCKTTTMEAARAGLQARIDSLGIVASPDQGGKTAKALAECSAQ